MLIFFRNYQKKTMNCLTGIFYACASFMRLVVFSGNATFDLEFLPLYILTPSAVVIGAYFGTKMNISQSAFKTYLTCIVWTCGWSALLTNTSKTLDRNGIINHICVFVRLFCSRKCFFNGDECHLFASKA